MSSRNLHSILQYPIQYFILQHQFFRDFAVLFLMKVGMAVGLDCGSHVDGFEEIGFLHM